MIRRIAWQKYLFEVITIFVGITLTLLADGWKEDLAERKKEMLLLRQLRDNLAGDYQYLKEEISILKEGIRISDFFLSPDLSPKRLPLPPDSSKQYSRMLQMYSTFPFNATAYQVMRETRDGQLITNLKLLGKIIRLYERNYFDLREYNTIDKNLILDRLMPHLEANFNSTNDILHPANRNALRSAHFRNIVYNSRHFKRIQVRLYENQLPVIDSLIREVEVEVKRLE